MNLLVPLENLAGSMQLPRALAFKTKSKQILTDASLLLDSIGTRLDPTHMLLDHEASRHAGTITAIRDLVVRLVWDPCCAQTSGKLKPVLAVKGNTKQRLKKN
jgi:hypothetical protein